MNFTAFNFEKKLQEGIQALGYETATPVQEQAIPHILAGKDIMASAQTGTGKTAAFLLPIIQKIMTTPDTSPVKALVIVPTRELAVQIDQNMEGLSYFCPVSSIAVYGGGDGNSFSQEQTALSSGVDVVICTPGRMIAHLNMGYVKFTGVKYLVLDEADRMLDMGFFDDIMKILSFLPAKRQNLMFAATMPKEIRELTKKILHHPVEINIALSKPAEKILQLAYVVYDPQKIPFLKSLLKDKKMRSILVFCSTKQSTKDLSRELKKAGISADDIHSDLEQQARENVLMRFKNRQLNVLVATDVLSRGIDIEDIDLIINFDVPHDGEDYIHRIGRTARAEADGVAITLISEREQRKFAAIERMLGKPVYKAVLPVEFGTTPAYEPEKHRGGGRSQGRRGDGGTGRQGDGGTGRRGDKGTGRQGDGGTGRRGDGETGRRRR